MSFAKNRFQQAQYPQLRESLSPEELTRNQIQKCYDAFNENNLDYIHSTVETLRMSLSTPAFTSKDFLSDIQDLAEDWDVEKEEKTRQYRRALKAALGGCPDLVDKPSMQPSLEYYQKMFLCCLTLCEEKGITWRQKTTESVGFNPPMGAKGQE